MRKNIITGLFLTVLFSAGAMAGPPYQSLVDVSDVKFSRKHADNPLKHTKGLADCLIDAFAKEYHKQTISFSEPTLEAAFYEKQCANEEKEAYIALYSMFEAEIEDFDRQTGLAQAAQGIQDIKEISFRAITKEFDLGH